MSGRGSPLVCFICVRECDMHSVARMRYVYSCANAICIQLRECDMYSVGLSPLSILSRLRFTSWIDCSLAFRLWSEGARHDWRLCCSLSLVVYCFSFPALHTLGLLTFAKCPHFVFKPVLRGFSKLYDLYFSILSLLFFSYDWGVRTACVGEGFPHPPTQLT
jgi:hypothetical protein